ncbi:MAG: hypothetical protein AAB308_15020, partial [Nitrospirota bacterium]
FSMNLLNPASHLNAIIILLGVSSVLFYFFFSIEHSGVGKAVARTGILFLMISFGAGFGYTVMARMSLLIGRLTDLIEFSDPAYGSVPPLSVGFRGILKFLSVNLPAISMLPTIPLLFTVVFLLIWSKRHQGHPPTQ